MRTPKIAGRWAFSGYQAGRGAVLRRNHDQVQASKADEFQTETRYVAGEDRRDHPPQGKALIYTGFQWRGRSFEGPPIRTECGKS